MSSTLLQRQPLAKYADIKHDAQMAISPLLTELEVEGDYDVPLARAIQQRRQEMKNADIHSQSWYHAKIMRIQAEALMVNNGDFLVS
jgi:hypothetical protein